MAQTLPSYPIKPIQPLANFSFEYKDAMYFKSIIKFLHLFGKVICFHINSGGINSAIMDPTRVAMFDLSMSASCFDVFEVQRDGAFSVDLGSILDKLRIRHKGESISLLTKGDAEMVADALKGTPDKHLHIMSIRDEDTVRNFYMVFNEGEAEDQAGMSPNIKLACTAKLTTKGMGKAVEDAVNNLLVKVELAKIVFEEEDKYYVEFEKNNPAVLGLQTKDTVVSKYSAKWINKIVGALIPLSESVEVQLDSDMPIKLSVQLKYGGELVCWVAPIIRP